MTRQSVNGWQPARAISVEAEDGQCLVHIDVFPRVVIPRTEMRQDWHDALMGQAPVKFCAHGHQSITHGVTSGIDQAGQRESWVREFIEKLLGRGPSLSALVAGMIAVIVLLYAVRVLAFIAGFGTYAEITIDVPNVGTCRAMFGAGEDVLKTHPCVVRGTYRLHPVTGGLVIDLKDRTVELPDGMKRVRAIRYLD